MILGRYHDIIHDIMISIFDSDGPPYACLAVDQNKCHFAIKISVTVHIRVALRIDSRSNQK